MQNSFRRSNICSVILNIWQFRYVLKSSRNNQVQEEDLMLMKAQDDTSQLVHNLTHSWNIELHKSKPSFMRAFHRSFLSRFLLYTIIGIFCEGIMPFYLYLTKDFIDFLGDPEADSSRGFLLMGSIFALLILTLLTRHYFYFTTMSFGVVMRKALTGFIYRKILKLSQASLAKASAGKLVNIASGDMTVIERGITRLPNVVVSPAVSFINFIFIYLVVSKSQFQIGKAAFYSLIVIVVMYFLQIPINLFLVKIRLLIASATDTRLNLINKLILGIATIKMYSWEEPLIEGAKKARRVECRRFLKSFIMKGLSDGLYRNVRVVMWMPVILAKVWEGELLLASSIFVMMNMMGTLGFNTIFRINLAMNSVAEYSTVLKRIEEVLLLGQIKQSHCAISESQSFRLRMERVTSTWGFLEEEEENNERKIKDLPSVNAVQEAGNLKEGFLAGIEQEKSEFRKVNKELNFALEQRTLLTVIGRVGSGKSSLLATVMGETAIIEGNMQREGKIAYVEQEPCILSDTVRNNILFGLPLDQARLYEVIGVCELTQDLKLFTRGLDTEIGERGVNISGGQKARLSLARACYSNADIYLLDDPLSAVDPNVAQSIFNNCIKGYLREKARILVTHQVSFLNRVDLILMLEDGQQTFLGNYQDLKQYESERGSQLSEVLLQFQRQSTSPATRPLSPTRRTSHISHQSDIAYTDECNVSIIEEQEKEEVVQEDLIIKEEKSVGRVSWRTYFNQCNLTSSWILNILALFLAISVPVLNGYLRLFITDWVSSSLEQQDTAYYVWGYISLSIASLVAASLATLSIAFLYLYFSQQLHNKMLNSVTRAPIIFFDSNPLGRIINRFSKDTAVSDGTLPEQLYIFSGIFWQCLMYVTMSVIVFPYLLIIVVIVLVAMIFVRNTSLIATMDSLRYDAITRSPMNSMFSASLTGLMTIRAYNQANHFERKFQSLVDHNGSAFFSYIASSRWMGYYLDYLSALYILCTIGFAFVLRAEGLNTALVALGITSSMSLLGPLQFLIRTSADVSNSMTSIQRMYEYSALESEPPAVLKTDKELVAKQWPQGGDLELFNANMRYRENFPLVLKDISFGVGSGMKVGVVGRTGAGKSSLLKAIFRLSECEAGSQIVIDGVKTNKIGLRTLRQAISIIPQSPFIFEGTVRENLDPFREYQDTALWEALSDVQLMEYVKSFPEGMGQEISDGTSVFSVGQKQLICLARAILRNNRILVMDEATANVDMDTEALIQQKIHEKFSSCTVITIAHRLDTVIESDRILVLKAGEAIQFAHPHKLLENAESYFSGMVRATGSHSEKVLRERAKSAYLNQHFS